MKKRYLILLLLLIIPFIKINASIATIDSYVDNKPYSNGQLLINRWGYDVSAKKYIKTDSEGSVHLRLDNPIEDPVSPRGKINIKAIVPSNLQEEQIEVIIYNEPYKYTFVLNKTNNFEINEEVIEGTYRVNYVSVVNHYDEYQVDYSSSLNIYRDKETKFTLDYSEYKKTYVSTGKKKNNKRIIIYIFAGLFVTFIFVILYMYLKAREV